MTINQSMTNRQIQAVYRNNLSAFIARSFSQIANDKYRHNWHIDLLASKLEECRLGKVKRLIVTIPPRNLKSISVSIAFSTYLLGHNPSEEVITVSYNQELADKLSSDSARLMQSGWYGSLFPNTIVKRATSSLLETYNNGRRYATGTGGTLTGLGANFIIIDDPIKPADANSETMRNRCNDWFDSTLSTRLNSKKDGCIIIIMQRLHEDDLVGYLLDKSPQDWEIVNLPAIALKDETIKYHKYLCGECTGNGTIYRRSGEALHPEREDIATLDKLRANMGEYGFSAQYLQQPAPLGGGIIKKDWLCYLAENQYPQSFSYVTMSIDAAQSITESADYSAITIWGTEKGESSQHHKYYLLHI